MIAEEMAKATARSRPARGSTTMRAKNPEAEQCGWCRDRFGVSWQIIPSNMGDLVNSPALNPYLPTRTGG